MLVFGGMLGLVDLNAVPNFYYRIFAMTPLDTGCPTFHRNFSIVLFPIGKFTFWTSGHVLP